METSFERKGLIWIWLVEKVADFEVQQILEWARRRRSDHVELGDQVEGLPLTLWNLKSETRVEMVQVVLALLQVDDAVELGNQSDVFLEHIVLEARIDAVVLAEDVLVQLVRLNRPRQVFVVLHIQEHEVLLRRFRLSLSAEEVDLAGLTQLAQSTPQSPLYRLILQPRA